MRLLGWVWVLWVQPFSAQPSKVPSMGPSRARVTPVEEERGKPTLVEARHQEEEQEEGSRRLMGTRGFSCLQGKAVPVIPMGGKEGKLLARMSLAQGSLVDSLVELPTVATAVTTPSPSTTMASTVTSRTRASTTPASTTKAPTTRTRASTTRTRASTTPAPTARTDASVTTARPSVTRMVSYMVRARGATARGASGATPPAGATTAATSRPPRGSQATPGPTELAAVKDDDTNVLWHYLNSELLKLEIHMC